MILGVFLAPRMSYATFTFHLLLFNLGLKRAHLESLARARSPSRSYVLAFSYLFQFSMLFCPPVFFHPWFPQCQSVFRLLPRASSSLLPILKHRASFPAQSFYSTHGGSTSRSRSQRKRNLPEQRICVGGTHGAPVALAMPSTTQLSPPSLTPDTSWLAKDPTGPSAPTLS